MGYSDKKNKGLLQKGIKSSLGAECHWYPLSLSSEWYKKNPTVVPIWDLVCISYEDFKGLVEANGMWACARNPWEKVFSDKYFSQPEPVCKLARAVRGRTVV